MCEQASKMGAEIPAVGRVTQQHPHLYLSLFPLPTLWFGASQPPAAPRHREPRETPTTQKKQFSFPQRLKSANRGKQTHRKWDVITSRCHSGTHGALHMKPSQEGGGVTVPRGIREKDRYEITEGRGLEQSIGTG